MLDNDSKSSKNIEQANYGITKQAPTTLSREKPKGKKKIPICWFYSKGKSCKFEENCRFRHSDPKKVNINRVNSSAYPVSSSLPEEKVLQKEKDPTETHQEQLTQEFQLPENNDDRKDLATSHISENGIDRATEKEQDEDNLKKNGATNHTVDKNTSSKQSFDVKERRKNTPCYYFRRFKYCKFDERCHFLHEVQDHRRNQDRITQNKEYELGDAVSGKEIAQESSENGPVDCNSVTNGNQSKPPDIQSLNTKNIPLDSLNSNLLQEFRQIEETQLKRRFRGKNIQEIDGHIFVNFKSSDPDWPFEVSSVWIKVEIPEEYPKEMLLISVCDEKNDLMPELLIKFLTNSIFSWLSERHNQNLDKEITELVFRPFMKWFDRHLEDLFVEGLKSVQRDLSAKAAGLEFVSPTELQISLSKTETSILLEENNRTNVDDAPSEILVKGKSEEVYLPLDLEAKSACLGLLQLSIKSEKECSIPVDNTKDQKGTAIKAIDYTLSENVATLICTKISVTVQCTRCRTKADFDGTPKRKQKLTCQKCNYFMNITFRSTILHQYSAVIGYLDLEGCKAFDVILLKCEFNVTCLNCNKSFSIMGLSNGHSNTYFCLKCHAKTDIMLSTFKFQLLDSPSMSSEIDNKLVKKKKELKDSVIQDGKPLPDNGTCKHYKKSFRWMRFPCCGKFYPCDVCHDEKEIDHEMKYSVRMLCGYCAKEQTFSVDKPCIRCHSDLTKKSKGHWDNGKGCRDKVKMSKDDKQKYSGLSKTVARNVEDKKAAKKK